MSEASEVNKDLEHADLSAFNGSDDTAPVKTETAKTRGRRKGRVAKKTRSKATLAARNYLRGVLRSEMKRRGISKQDMADMQQSQRQYIYRVLSDKEDAASLDQLIGFLDDIGVEVNLQAVL